MRKALVLCVMSGLLSAQAWSDVVIDDEALLISIELRCEELRGKGELHTVSELAKDCDGRRCELAFAPVVKEPLAPPLLPARLCRSTLVVGHYYECKDCHDFHFTASSGFAVGKAGVIATCYHLLEDDSGLPAACLVVADWAGNVWPVTSVLAADRAADVALLQCTATNLLPLPLRLDVCAGERIWCLSNPDHLFASFSEGLIARRYVVRSAAPGMAPLVDPEAAPVGHKKVVDQKARVLTFLQVTCEFAVGSSGGPVVDACGNLVGIAQSTTTVFADPETEPVETQMVVRSAVPSAALRALLK